MPTPAATVADGIVRLALPTPFPIGDVNAYLIDDDPLTLFDAGPLAEPTLATLEEGLLARGRRIEEIGRIVISHQHIDHWGLAATVQRLSGAEVYALDGLHTWLGAHPEAMRAEGDWCGALLTRHGVDADSRRSGSYRGGMRLGEAIADVRPLRDGDVLAFAGRELRARFRPGHSSSDLVLHDERRGVLLGADHVMRARSVPILTPPLTGPAPSVDCRPTPLADYRASLAATRAMDLELVLPGHGEVVSDHRAVIDERLAEFDELSAGVREAVTATPALAIDIAGAARGRPVRSNGFFVVCETLGYLDELIAGGEVEEVDVDGVAMFRSARW